MNDEFDPATLLPLIRQLLVRELGVDPSDIHPEADLVDDLCMDSMALLNFALLLSETFDIEVEAEHLSEFLTLADAVRVVERLCREAA